MGKLFDLMNNNPGKAMGCIGIMLLNIALFLGGVGVIAVAARWALTGKAF